MDEKRAPKRAIRGPISHGGHGGVCVPIELTAEVRITILAALARGRGSALPCTLWGSSSSASLDLAAQDR